MERKRKLSVVEGEKHNSEETIQVDVHLSGELQNKNEFLTLLENFIKKRPNMSIKNVKTSNNSQEMSTSVNTHNESQGSGKAPLATRALQENFQVNFQKCNHCLQMPCITKNPPNLLKGTRAANIRNHTFRHKDYKTYWKVLNGIGYWMVKGYKEMKSAAGLDEKDVRELMPACVVEEVRKRYPNPDGIPYMGHKRN